MLPNTSFVKRWSRTENEFVSIVCLVSRSSCQWGGRPGRRAASITPFARPRHPLTCPPNAAASGVQFATVSLRPLPSSIEMIEPSDFYRARLFFGDRLDIVQPSFKVLADHLVHVAKKPHDLGQVGTGSTHCPVDIRRIALGLQRELGHVVAFKRPREIQMDRELAGSGHRRDLHVSRADIVVAVPGVLRPFAAG